MVRQKNNIGIMGIKEYIMKQRGAVFVLTAIMLPAFLGFLGFAYDFGNLYIHKTKLQNIADAAALAGGRAFLESQEKTQGPKDTVDAFPGKDGVPDREEDTSGGYVVGGLKNQSGNHPDADKAADDYIIKNIVNLNIGRPVNRDKYSHMALNSAGANPKTFYRIGLYEYVPLYFLPIILDRKEQLVRAGAVVVVEQGTIAGQTLFDKLFSLEDKINLNRQVVSPQGDAAMQKTPNEGGATIQTTFDGDIIFASDEWDSVKANAIVQDNQTGGYVYTKAEQAYQLANNISIYDMNNIPNMGSKSTWDNSIKIDSYVTGFLNKLTRPHVDLLKSCNSDKEYFKTSELSQYHNNSVKHYTVTSSKGTVIYYHKNNGKYFPCGGYYEQLTGNTYYSFQKEGSGFNVVGQSWVPCSTYVFDEKGNQIFCYKNENDGSWSYYKKNIITHTYDWGTQTEINYQKLPDSISLISDDVNGTTYSYNNNGTSVSFTIEKLDIDFSQGIEVNDREYENYSVYHWERDGGQPVTLQVNGGLNGSESSPVYIVLTGGSPIKIHVTQSNERPIIFCNLTTIEINEFVISPGVTFKGTIYSPYSVVNNVHSGTASNGGGTFKGNIIAKALNVQDPGTSWTQQNFVADDSDLNKVTEDQAKAQQERKKLAIQYAKAKFAQDYSELGITEDAWNNPNWFSSQGDKQSDIQKAWYAVRQSIWDTYGLDMPDWPWAVGGKTTDTDKHHYDPNDDSTTGGKLRLINFRTEYISEPYIDPFTELFLVDE